MPFVEITIGTGFLSSEEKVKLNKAVNDSILEVLQEVKGIRPKVWVVIREHPPDNWLINGETLTEVRKKRSEEK